MYYTQVQVVNHVEVRKSATDDPIIGSMQGSVGMLQSEPLGVIVALELPGSGFLQTSKLPTPNCIAVLLRISFKASTTHLDGQSSNCLPRHLIPTARHAGIPKDFRTHTFNKVVRFMKGNQNCLQQTCTSPAECELSSEATDSFDTFPSAVQHAVSTAPANDPKPEPDFTRLHAHVRCAV